MFPVAPKAQPAGLSPEVASASAHPKVAIAVDPLCQDANQPDWFRVKPLRRRNIFCCIDIPSALQPTRLASTTPAHEVFFEAIAPSSTTVPDPPLASTRSGWPVATPELHPPKGMQPSERHAVISVCNPHTLFSFQRRAPVSCVATVAGFPLTVNRRFSHWRFTSADRRRDWRACYSLQTDVDRASAAPSSPPIGRNQ